jgi:hypothetical protein
VAVFVLYSFEFCIFVIHVLCAARHWVDRVDPMKYLYVFSAEGVSAACFAIPCMTRLDSFGQAKRLETDLLPIAQAKSQRQRGGAGGARAVPSHI